MSSQPSVAIIIPFQEENTYLEETLHAIKQLDYPSIEVVLLPDEALSNSFADQPVVQTLNCRIIPTGPVSPAIKRDKGVAATKAQLVAFIDDDAYPDVDWLNNAIGYFDDRSVCAVGGPQVTPDSDSFWQKVSGAMFVSPLNGSATQRYWPSPSAEGSEVDDWPTVNLIVRRDDFLAVDGFDNAFWPGEDTKLCLDLIEKLNKRIVYASSAIVFHHRRSGFRRHLRQVGNYGLHRGYFARKYPATSFRLTYFLPTIFVAGLVLALALVAANLLPNWLLLAGLATYLIAHIVSATVLIARIKSILIGLATIPYLIATHLWYGIRFAQGFFVTRSLVSSLGR